jgi:hypothetical protein
LGTVGEERRLTYRPAGVGRGALVLGGSVHIDVGLRFGLKLILVWVWLG